jgi:hypothetical protein
MLASLTGQIFMGWDEHNITRLEDGLSALSLWQYVASGHFLSATFENWESEFLQMMMYVLFTVWLHQKGSAESKPLAGKSEVDRKPRAHENAPWPVKRGGWILKVYEHSLALAFGLLFLMAFWVHFYGSLVDHNEEQLVKGMPVSSAGEFLGSSRFWFESFQNWQSEFLAVFSIVVLSIWLRQKGSPESKPVDMAHSENPE